MRARPLLATVVALVLGLAGVVAVASPSLGEPATTWTITPRRPAIHLRSSTRCPKNVRGYHDVTNIEVIAREVLVPPGPDSVLICRYGSFPPSSKGDDYGLVRARHLGRKFALKLVTAIDSISTARPTGTAACPASFATATVLAFDYASGLSVDLWYADSGCETIDDGYLEASEVGHPQFYLKVGPLIGRLAPRGT